MHRYYINVEFIDEAETDEEAYEQAQEMMDVLRKTFPETSLMSIVNRDFGKEPREVNLNQFFEWD